MAGEFLVMAATLIHIKSRMLLPRPDPTQEDAGGGSARGADAPAARASEVQGGGGAAARARDAAQRAVDAADGPIAEIAGEAPEPEIEVDLFSLISAFRAVVERAKQRPKIYLPGEQIPIEDRIEQLMAQLSETEACGFEDLFADVQTRAGMIVTFLAMLEMIRLKLIRVFQSGAMGRSGLQARAPGRRAQPLLDPNASPPRSRSSQSKRPSLQENRRRTRVRPSQTDRRSADLRVAGAGDAEDALQAARGRAERGRGRRARGGARPTTRRPAVCSWSRSRAATRSSRGPSCTNGSASCSTSGRRRSCRCSRSRRWPSSPTSSRSPPPEIAEIRGVTSSGGVLSTLIERRLIKTVGRKQVVGRPFMYATTREFLERFGLNDLSDLPKVEEMSDALGFELPSGLSEPTATATALPFETEPAHSRSADEPAPVVDATPAAEAATRRRKSALTCPSGCRRFSRRRRRLTPRGGRRSSRRAASRSTAARSPSSAPRRSEDGRHPRRRPPRQGASARRYILLYKPRGYITTPLDPEHRPTVIDLLAEGRCPGLRLSGRATRLRLGRAAAADERRRSGGAADASTPWRRARVRSARARRARSARSGAAVARHRDRWPPDGAGGRRADQGDRRGEADSRRCSRSSFTKGATGRCATCATRSGIRWSGSGACASARSPTSTFARASSASCRRGGGVLRKPEASAGTAFRRKAEATQTPRSAEPSPACS